MIDEVARRKPEFEAGTQITLADGQQWWIPKPKFRFKPKFVDGKIEIGGGATFGPEHEAEVEIVFGVVDVPGDEFIRARFALTIGLLRANYELADDELSELLIWEINDAASDARWEGIRDALQGVAPKPSPAI